MASLRLLLAVAPAIVLPPLAMRDTGAATCTYGLVLAVAPAAACWARSSPAAGRVWFPSVACLLI